MSIAARNRLRGSTCQVHRPLTVEGTGGQAVVLYPLLLVDTPIELLPVTDEIARQIFGLDDRIDCSALVPRSLGIARGDGVAVSDGAHAGERFFVLAARQLGDYRRGYIELALQATTLPFEPEAT